MLVILEEFKEADISKTILELIEGQVPILIRIDLREQLSQLFKLLILYLHRRHDRYDHLLEIGCLVELEHWGFDAL